LEVLKSLSRAEITYFQSNVEGEIINMLQGADHDGIILNAGGYTHTSVAIRDCVSAIQVPVVEVHLSNITSREEFRHTSLISPVAAGCIFGFGMDGYRLALNYFESKRR
jgi:3-dehydroquinate dehydratase-2